MVLRPGNAHEVVARWQIIPCQAIRFPHESPDSVAANSVAEFLRYRQADSGMRTPIFAGIDNERAVCRGSTPIVHSLKIGRTAQMLMRPETRHVWTPIEFPINSNGRFVKWGSVMTPLGLVLSDDLLDASRVIGEGRAAGLHLLQCKDSVNLLAAAGRRPVLAILDLNNPGLDVRQAVVALKAIGARVLAFGSHVDAERLKLARQAGCDEVLPRSAFFEGLNAKIAKWSKPD